MRAMIIPGNGNTDISENWFPYAKNALEKLGVKVIAKNMPDPELARKEYWLPFIEQQLAGDSNAILIGHSSGATAILRYLERHKAQGAVLVGAYYTDLGEESERKSGYFNEPWHWEKIKQNAKWIIQFASADDPFIPIQEARYVHAKLNTEYHEYSNQGHMGADVNKLEFPELVEAIKKKL